MTLQPAWRWRALVSRFAIALLIFGVTTAGGIGYAFWYANNKVKEIPPVAIPPGIITRVKATDPANYLIVGSDSRAFVNDPIAAAHFGTTRTNPENLADVIMIAHVDPNTPGKGFLVSIPRDTWVSIPGHGNQKINAAFEYGSGPATLIQTINQNFGIKINHYLKLDFLAFTDIVNAIGHVHIFFPAPAFDDKTGLYVKTAGCVPLDGLQALAYARSRYYRYKTATSGSDPHDWKLDGQYDLGRIKRQQYFIRSLAREALAKSDRSPLTASSLIGKIVPHLERSKDVGLPQFLSLLRAFRSVNPGDVQMLTVPTRTETIGTASAQVVIDAQAQPIFALLGSFTPRAKPARTVKPSQVKVQVLNGSGVKGIAATTEQELQAAGFANGGTAGDAPQHDNQYTQVRYTAGHEDEARLVASYLGGVGLLTRSATTLGAADVVVVTGADLVGVRAPGSHGSSSSTSSTRATSHTSTSTPPPTTVFPNPGSTPGVAVPNFGGRAPVGCG